MKLGCLSCGYRSKLSPPAVHGLVVIQLATGPSFVLFPVTLEMVQGRYVWVSMCPCIQGYTIEIYFVAARVFVSLPKLRPCSGGRKRERWIERSRTTIITNMETQRRLVCLFSDLFPRFIGQVSELMLESGGLGDKPKRLEQRIAYR